MFNTITINAIISNDNKIKNNNIKTWNNFFKNTFTVSWG
jgi:hypothetical protein